MLFKYLVLTYEEHEIFDHYSMCLFNRILNALWETNDMHILLKIISVFDLLVQHKVPCSCGIDEMYLFLKLVF